MVSACIWTAASMAVAVAGDCASNEGTDAQRKIKQNEHVAVLIMSLMGFEIPASDKNLRLRYGL